MPRMRRFRESPSQAFANSLLQPLLPSFWRYSRRLRVCSGGRSYCLLRYDWQIVEQWSHVSFSSIDLYSSALARIPSFAAGLEVACCIGILAKNATSTSSSTMLYVFLGLPRSPVRTIRGLPEPHFKGVSRCASSSLARFRLVRPEGWIRFHRWDPQCLLDRLHDFLHGLTSRY